jgi:hypothetical protein
VPLKYRALVTELAYQLKPETQGLPPKIKDAVEHLHHIHWVELNGKQRFISHKRPQGKQDGVLARVTADEAASEKFLSPQDKFAGG